MVLRDWSFDREEPGSQVWARVLTTATPLGVAVNCQGRIYRRVCVGYEDFSEILSTPSLLIRDVANS